MKELKLLRIKQVWRGYFDPAGEFHPIQGYDFWTQFLTEIGDTEVALSIERSAKRSGQQNNRYWGVIVPAVLDYHNKLRAEEGKLDKDQMHSVLKRAFLTLDSPPQDNIFVNGINLFIDPATKSLSKKQFMDYCDEIQGYYAGLGVVFKDDPE